MQFKILDLLVRLSRWISIKSKSDLIDQFAAIKSEFQIPNNPANKLILMCLLPFSLVQKGALIKSFTL